MKTTLLRQLLLPLAVLAASPLFAHWEPSNPSFTWATPGQLRWLIDYAKMDKPHVELMLDAGFNLLQGGSFTPAAREVLVAHPGVHSMMYICSRTIYHEILFPRYPQLKDAAILNPDGSYKIIYNNPKRYAGCWNRPAWLAYIKERLDEVKARGNDTVFFDNPMTWACYCPTCQELFTRFAKEKTGQDLKLNQFGKPTELENWFTIDTAVRFWTQVRDYAHSQGLFLIANNMTYWLINQGLVDGVFSETGGHAPFVLDPAAYKIGLAASHGKPTGILDYVPQAVRMARGRTEFNASSGSGQKWVGAPLAEEFQVALAQGLACGGNYIANFQLELGRRIEELKLPEDQKIVSGLKSFNAYIASHPELYAKALPASPVAVLYSLTTGPREGQILGMSRGAVNKTLWTLVKQGVPAEVIVEDDLTPERLAEVKTVLVSDVAVLEPEAAERLAAFARSGGTVILAGSVAVRGKFEDPAKARGIGTIFPGVAEITKLDFLPADFSVEAYEPQPPWLKLTAESGKASATFKAKAGQYRLNLAYFDESDGQGSFEVLVDGVRVGEWRNTRDDDQTHVHNSAPVALKPGAVITVVGHQGGGEYGRIERLSLSAAVGSGQLVESKFGRGKVVQAPMTISQLAGEPLNALAAMLRPQCPVRCEQPLPDKLLLNLTRGPAQGPLCAHLVNYNFKYDDKYNLQEIVPAPPVTLIAPGVKQARLLSPFCETQTLKVSNGRIEVPATTIYGVVVAN